MKRRLWHEIVVEMLPFHGRLATAWRVAALCALATLVFMTYGIPLVAIACYLILFVMKPDPAESTLMAIGISVLVCMVVALMFFLTRLSIESPMWRMVILATSSFLFLYMGAASQLGPAGGIIALVIGFIMTLIGDAPFGELATRALLYAWLMALVPMGLIIAFNAACGRSSVRLLREGLAQRLRLVAYGLNSGATSAHDDLLHGLRKGNKSLESYARFVRLFHLVAKEESRALSAGIARSYAAMLATTAFKDMEVDNVRAGTSGEYDRVCQRYLLLADAVERGELGGDGLPTAMANDAGVTRTGGQSSPVYESEWDIAGVLDEHLSHFGEPLAVDESEADKEGFFYSDALTNPAYQRFALKTTASALICYIVYTALDWQDIHTAMITCYVAALGTTGETLHKLTLRIVGCLIGAAMGVLSIFFLMPLMTSIGELMALVFAGILCAAWISCGSERISYAGVQVGLAFLLTVLQGFGPDVQMSVAMDRIIGILLGNTVLYLVFTRVWPVSAVDAVQRTLCGVLDTVQACMEQRSVADNAALLQPTQAAGILATVESSKDELTFQHFEPQALRPSITRLTQLQSLVARIESLIVRMALPPDQACLTHWTAQVTEMRRTLTTGLA